MSFKLLLVAGIVGGAFATTAFMWLAGMAVERVRQPFKRARWVFVAVLVTLVAGALASGTIYSVYVATTFHGWFAQPVLIFSGNWAGELGCLFLLVWAVAVWRGLAPVAPVYRQENLPQAQSYGQSQAVDAQV